MKDAGYNRQKMRTIGPTESDMVHRRVGREPVEKGGRSAMCLVLTSFDLLDPAVNGQVRDNGLAAFPDWPTSAKPEHLNDTWFGAPDLAGRKAIAAEIRRVALESVTMIPPGWFKNCTALRRG